MEERNCKSVRGNLWDYAAKAPETEMTASGMTAPEFASVDAHLDSCRDCDRQLADISSLRTGFRHLPVQSLPPLVGTRLQVLASRDRSRRLLRLNPAAWLRDKFDGFMMAFDNFLRPYAVPATGGLLASCLCFSLLAQTLELRPYLGDNDMPVGVFTEMTFNDVSPFSFSGKDVTVQVTVDANGSITNYAMLPGSQPTAEEFAEIGGLLLYSTFTPAMRSGQRVSSQRLIAIHHLNYKIDSRGFTHLD